MAGEAQTPENQPYFNIALVYTKGVSLEIPNAPQVFREAGEMTADANLEVTVKGLEENFHEVSVRGTVTAKRADKLVYLLEIDQAGVFEVRNLSDSDRAQALGINGPAILASYLRTRIQDTLHHAGMPPFLLPEMNWGAIFAEQQKAQANKGAAAND